MQQKIIGIVGGMGPQAGVVLHEAIIRNTVVEKDQDHLAVALMTFPQQIIDRTAYLEDNTLVNPATSILTIIEKLVSVGAEVIGIPCNTSHAPEIFEPIRQSLSQVNGGVTLLHLPTEVIGHINQNHPRNNRVGVMATNGTYKSGIYQKLLVQHGYDVVVPLPEFQDTVIHRMIYDPEIGIKARSVSITPEVSALWHQALAFFKERAVDTIILGCTELSLLHQPTKDGQIAFIDTIDVLAKSLIREAKCSEAKQQINPNVLNSIVR